MSQALDTHERAAAVLLAVNYRPGSTAAEVADRIGISEDSALAFLRAFTTAGVLQQRHRPATGAPGSRPVEFWVNHPTAWRTLR